MTRVLTCALAVALMGLAAPARADVSDPGSVTGVSVVSAPGRAEVVIAIRSGQVRRVEELRPDVPAALADAVHRSLLSEPEERYASARDMVQAIGDALRREGPFVDADLLVQTTVAQAREANRIPKLP